MFKLNQVNVSLSIIEARLIFDRENYVCKVKASFIDMKEMTNLKRQRLKN